MRDGAGSAARIVGITAINGGNGMGRFGNREVVDHERRHTGPVQSSRSQEKSAIIKGDRTGGGWTRAADRGGKRHRCAIYRGTARRGECSCGTDSSDFQEAGQGRGKPAVFMIRA